MEIAANNVKIVQKEELGGFKFSKIDVLSNDADRKKLRSIYLKKAEILGNNYKGKVKLTFADDADNIYAVETTVWVYSEEFVSLKGGVNIPTKSIIDIEF